MYIENIDKINEEIILSDDLYIEILQIDDEVKKARILIAIQEKAKFLGKKAEFEKLFRAFVKQKKKSDSEVEVISYRQNSNSGMTEFNGKYQDFRCGLWVANESGVRIYTPFGEKEACSHPIIPIQILTNAETGFCKVKIAFKLKGRWKEVVVDKEIISSSSKIVTLSKYGIRVTSENSKTLVQYMSDMESMNEDFIIEQISTSKLGWINEEFMPYGSNIIFDNEQSFKTVFESVREHGSREKWYDLVKDIRSKQRVEPQINLIASIASPIIELVNGLPFIVDLYGKTGSGKTVSMMLAASVWANPDNNEYITDPKSTVTALELRLDFLNNLPILIDDMAQLKNKYDADFSELVYFLCSGKGKDRANQNLGINKSTTWKNVMLVNSEHSMVTETMQGGAINRIIDIEARPGSFFEDGNHVVSVLNENYGFCGKEFIEILKDLGTERIREMQKEYEKKIIEAAKILGVDKEEKQIIPMSILLLADYIATTYLFCDDRFLDFDYCVSLLKNKGEVDEDERAYQFILDEIQMNGSRFAKKVDEFTANECWGLIEENSGVVIINNNAFKKIIEKGGYSEKGFLSWAIKNNKVEVDPKGNAKKPKRIGQTIGRCIFLKTSSFLEISEDGFVKINEDFQEKLPFE